MEDLKEFKSNDFYLSACILASGVSLKGLERRNDKFKIFVFQCSSFRAEQIIADHWSRKLKIPTRDLIEAINELKTRLHSGV